MKEIALVRFVNKYMPDIDDYKDVFTNITEWDQVSDEDFKLLTTYGYSHNFTVVERVSVQEAMESVQKTIEKIKKEQVAREKKQKEYEANKEAKAAERKRKMFEKLKKELEPNETNKV